MSKQNFNGSALGQIGSLIDEINAHSIKVAAAKKAEEAGGTGSAKKDPGGYQGASSHPSAKADGGLHAAPVGFRSKENDEDVRSDVPDNVSVAPENHQDSDYDQIQTGVKKSPTGEDPSTEDAYKPDKEDPGTSHPANTEDVGEKYSSWSFPQLYKTACHKMEGVLARIAEGETFATQTNTRVVSTKEAAAAQAGYNLAAATIAGGTEEEQLTKLAAAANVVAISRREGYEDADLVGEFLYKTAAYEEQLLKAAEGGMPPGMGGEMPPGMEGGMPPGMEGGDLPPELAGGGGGGPPVDAAGAGPELGGMGGDGGPAPEPGPGGEGGGGGEEAVNEMANALIDAGIPPEKLIAALQGAAAGEGGEPGAVGGEKTSGAKMPRQDIYALYKVANDVSNLMENGRFRRTKLNPASKQAHDRREAVEYLSYVREVLGIR